MSDEPEPKTRSAGEKVRLRHSVATMRAMLDSLDTAVTLNGQIGSDLAQSILTSASVLVMQVAKHDAFELYEQDAKYRTLAKPKPCGRLFTPVAPGRARFVTINCTEEKRCPQCESTFQQWLAGHQKAAF